MQHVRTLELAFKKSNLLRAWEWILHNPEAWYKNYFRHIYSAYSMATQENLVHLSKRLNEDTFRPTEGIKLYKPKSSGVLRPVTLLGVEDQIVYQALTNVIAEQMKSKVKRYYNKKNYGTLYSGRRDFFFYVPWEIGYTKFTNAIRDGYHSGYSYIASFDLTACFDSIDHNVLKHMLSQYSLEREFCDYLCNLLKIWSATATSGSNPVFQEHGIPQGPMASGLIAECVLAQYDKNIKNQSDSCYFRYVDDIRIMAKSEKVIRKRLIQVDLLSKELGLFPQTGKIHIHEIEDVENEIKSISSPSEIVDQQPAPNQEDIRKRVRELSNRYEIKDETRFKYVLSAATPCAWLSRRLLKIVGKNPHLYLPISNHLAKWERIPRQVSRECVQLLEEEALYTAFTASFLMAIQGRIHEDYRDWLIGFCRRLLRSEKNRGPEIRAVAGSILLESGALDWERTRYLFEVPNWWTRSYIVRYIRKDMIGDPSYSHLINKLLRDKSNDLALVAAQSALESGLQISRPIRDINRIAQNPLRASGLIGRISSDSCFINDVFAESIDPTLEVVNWRSVFGTHYKSTLPKIARWRGYLETDPTAFVQMTDTINNVIVSLLFHHEAGSIGQPFNIGEDFGGRLNSRSRFARSYPDMFQAAHLVHRKRLESDLAHPITRQSGRYTRPINFDEIPDIICCLKKGYLELWNHW